MQNTNQVEQDETPCQPEQLRYLRSKIVSKPPYCQGTLAVPDDHFTLFYGTEGNAHRINLSAASPAQLQHLADTCAPATFGVAGEDVYDETYRRAGKLDNKDFSIGFDASRSSLVDVIRAELLVENPNKVKSEDLNVELYKLNVYGKDAFFKAHVDTPRSELMFGSLVIVFPTPHQGGALKLRAPGGEQGETMEWTFDSSALLAEQQQPSIAYVAFFSDVEHEVMPVTSGHRVTITYNLYYAVDSSNSEPSPLNVLKQISTNEQSFRDALHAILQDPSFLPDGGNLMFGLRHQYPLATAAKSARYVRGRQREELRARARETARASLRALEGRLKATDGVMLRALRARGLDATLKVLYEARWSQWTRDMGYMMADGVLPLPQLSEMIEESALDYLREEGGEVVQDAVVLRERAEAEAAGMTDDRSWYYDSDATPVYWVTDPPAVRSGKGFEKTIQTYGNEPALDVVYWRIWIFARVGPAGQRETAQAA